MSEQNDQNSGDKVEEKDGQDGGATSRTFTQSDVDKIVQERLARAKPADYDELKAKAARLDEIEAENATEQEKAIKAAREETRAEVVAEFQAERVADKIEIAAAGKFHDVEDARLRLTGRTSEFVTDDGAIDTDAIAKAVEEVLTANPHLKKAEEPVGPPSRQRVGLGVKGGSSGDADVKPGAGRLALAYSNGDGK